MSQKKFLALQHHLRLHDLETTRTIKDLWTPDGDYWGQPETVASMLMQVLLVIFLCVAAHKFRTMMGNHPGVMRAADDALDLARRVTRDEAEL